MYRFPDPLDEGALKGLMADKRFQDPRHPEHEFFKKFVAKAFELVHPDAPRDGAGRAVIDPRDPPRSQVVQGGEAFVPDESPSSDLGKFQSVGGMRPKEATENTNTGATPNGVETSRRDTPIGPITKTPVLRFKDDRGEGHFGASRGEGKDHKGSDMRTKKGDPILSPVDGVIVEPRFDPYGDLADTDGRKGKLSAIQIEDGEGRALRLLYVNGNRNLKPGMRIKKGDVIGTAEDVAGVYNSIGKPGMTNHVHVELWQPNDPARRAKGYTPAKDLRAFYTPRNAWQLTEMEGRD